MYLKCNFCQTNFSIPEEEKNLEGRLINCKSCGESWVFKNKIDYLENLLSDLDLNLCRTELKIEELNTKYNDKINLLEKDLKHKKEELVKQDLLEEKINNFEKRITQTEKSNSRQADLETRVFKMEVEDKELSKNIHNKNNNIEKKTKYLEMKVNYYKDLDDKNNIKKEKSSTIIDGDSDIIDFNDYEKNDTKKKKIKDMFSWPNKTTSKKTDQ